MDKKRIIHCRQAWLPYACCALLTAGIVAVSLFLPQIIAKRQRARLVNVVSAEAIAASDTATQQKEKLRLLLLMATGGERVEKSTLQAPQGSALSPQQAQKRGMAVLQELMAAGILLEQTQSGGIELPVYGEKEAVAGHSQYYCLTDLGTGEVYGYYLLLYRDSSIGDVGQLTLDAQTGQLLQLEMTYGNRRYHDIPPQELANAVAEYLGQGEMDSASGSASGMFYTGTLHQGEYTLQVGSKNSAPGGLSIWWYPKGMEAPYQDYYEGRW